MRSPAFPIVGNAEARARRLRAPLLRALWALLLFEAAGGTVIFVARLVAGVTPGEALHVVAGLALTVIFAAYLPGHWRRVAQLTRGFDYAFGLLAALFLAAANLTGLWLGAYWLRDRVLAPVTAEVAYPPAWTAAHNIASLLALSFVAAHYGAVWLRDRSGPRPPHA